MPTLTLRHVGMSHLIEGLDAPDLASDALLTALTARYGPAVAVMGERDPETDRPRALIVDRRAATWDALCAGLLDWVRDRGFAYGAWSDAAATPGQHATLHYHRS